MKRCKFDRHPIAVLSFVAVLAVANVTAAAVTRIDIEKRVPYANGRSFEGIGPYERQLGRIHFAVDPAHAKNQGIVDLKLAARNEKGLVEFSADFEILAPVDLSKASGTLLYDVNNRGKRLALGMFNTDADEFLMRNGYIVVWSGWIAEVLPGGEMLRLDAPIARDAGGKMITGYSRCEMVADEPTTRINVTDRAWLGAYAPHPESLDKATMSWRLRANDPRVPIPREQFRIEVAPVKIAGEKWCPPRVEAVMPGGFLPGYIYELIYTAQDPIVQGLGFAGIRDLVSHLKYGEKHSLCAAGEKGNAGKSVVRHAVGFGVSQSGRCLRTFLYEGFNADEDGRKVFDGLIPHVAGGGLGFFNHRFASPTRHATQHVNHHYPCDHFPFAYEDQHDLVSGRDDGILRAARAENVVPKVMHTQSSAEYWHRSGSIVHTDPLGTKDSVLPADVRIYSFGGAQHGAGNDVLTTKATTGQLPDNPTDYRPLLRALLTAMNDWVRDERSPPPSVYPRIADGTLVDWRGEPSGWKPLPGVRYPEVIEQPELLDQGPEFLTRRIITRPFPLVGKSYRSLAAAYGPDDNERGMLLVPAVSVPLATFTGWNLRSNKVGAATELMQLRGSCIPFARTAEERKELGDPRPAILERYKNHADYVQQYEAAARALVKQQYLLEEDVPRLLKRAEANKVYFEKPSAAKGS